MDLMLMLVRRAPRLYLIFILIMIHRVAMVMSVKVTTTLPLIFLLMIHSVASADWGVSYSRSHICALKDSTVIMSCTYSYPPGHQISKVFWTKELKQHQYGFLNLFYHTIEPGDLSEDHKYSQRLHYLGDKNKNCNIKLSHVTQEDSHEYYFRFITDQEKYIGYPGVSLSITDLQLESPERVTEGDSVHLTCKSSCELTDRPTFIWTRNSQRLTSANTGNKLILSPVTRGDAGRYRCAVDGHTLTSAAVQLNVMYVSITTQEGGTDQDIFQNLLEQIDNITTQSQVLPLEKVKNILTQTLNASEKIFSSSSSSSSVNQTELASVGNLVLKSSEKLISALVKLTNTSANVSFTLPTVEGQVFMVGPQSRLEKIPKLYTTNSSVDIDLIGIAKNNNEGSAAVAFMSYNTMENLLKPDFFNTSNDTIKTMMSTVISATLPKTTNTRLTKPVNFTLTHIREWDPNGSLSCVYWNISEWIVDGCSVVETSNDSTVCSCVHLSTFALIMQTSRPPESNPLLDLLGLVCVSVGLLFFSLALLTFTLCRWSPGVNNVARINICISLLSAHLLFLLTQQFLKRIQPKKVLCVVISGLLHFLFLSAFVWMFIEAVLLFICVRNLSQISSKKREVLSSKSLIVIGYVVALVVVAVAVGIVPDGYGSEQCWIKIDKGFIWSFLGPVCVILPLNLILFIKIIISLISTFKSLNAEVSKMKQTKIMVFKTLAQFMVFGCPWILGFFTHNSIVLKIFLILNSQQGTFIFLIYCVLNHEVRQQYRKLFRCLFCIKQHRETKAHVQEIKSETLCTSDASSEKHTTESTF